MTGARPRVGVTREGDGAARLADRLRSAGMDPVVVPLIERGPSADGGAALRRALRLVADGDRVVVTSPNGADALLDALGDDRLAPGVRVAAVGPATADRLTAGGVGVDLVPDRYDAAALAEALVAEEAPGRTVLALSALADDTIEAALSVVGHPVDRVEAYRIVGRRPSREQAAALTSCDVVTLASGSAAVALAATTTGVPVVCMGRVTADRAGSLGLDVRAVADPSNLEGLVTATALALDHPIDHTEELTEP